VNVKVYEVAKVPVAIPRFEKVAIPEEFVTAVCVPLRVAPALIAAVMVTPACERLAAPKRSWIDGWVVRALPVTANVRSVALCSSYIPELALT
jgi:hypothetical protein